ncbi:hypothetical protein [Bacillus wiedmannii]|uniref:hypothetical protein n=1 Tax=Bacillus wiedmannii TaxID=1890302 RepID=UPI000B434455|nr:hypothetical protein BK740_20740 [Bacillus thuringiensis serovar argentinensis]
MGLYAATIDFTNVTQNPAVTLRKKFATVFKLKALLSNISSHCANVFKNSLAAFTDIRKVRVYIRVRERREAADIT